MSKYPSKQAKFFCESCGSEVPKNSKVCLTCGRFFAAVRCPNCGKTGSSQDFSDGCPQCGYAVDENKKMNNIKQKDSVYKNDNSDSYSKSRFGRISFRKSLYSPESSLPVWVYIVVISIFFVMVFCLYKCMI